MYDYNKLAKIDLRSLRVLQTLKLPFDNEQRTSICFGMFENQQNFLSVFINRESIMNIDREFKVKDVVKVQRRTHLTNIV